MYQDAVIKLEVVVTGSVVGSNLKLAAEKLATEIQDELNDQYTHDEYGTYTDNFAPRKYGVSVGTIRVGIHDR